MARRPRPARLLAATMLLLLSAHVQGGVGREYRHTGGGPTSAVMRTIISKLPAVTPPSSGVRDGGALMRTVRLTGAYSADVPLVLPSYTRLVLEGSITAVPYQLAWTPER